MNLDLLLRRTTSDKMSYFFAKPLYKIGWKYTDGFGRIYNKHTTVYDIEIDLECLSDDALLKKELINIISIKERCIITEPYKLKITQIIWVGAGVDNYGKA